MPANLPPEYYAAETRFKNAASAQEKISALEALISTVPKHKGTDKLRADLRRRLSKLRDESARRKKSGRSDIFSVEKQGAAQAALVGLPNSGKSSILGLLTNAKPVIASYPLSTMLPLSGMMPYQDIQFQLVDLPPIGNESTDGWVSGILRNADVLLLVIDLSEAPVVQAGLLIDQIKGWGIPLLSGEKAKAESTEIEDKPLIMVANKSDIEGSDEKLGNLRRLYESACPVIGFSVTAGEGGDELAGTVFRLTGIIRVYTKVPGKEADTGTPFTIRRGSSVLDLAEHIHKDFMINFKYACIWGSARFNGQRVHKDHILLDGDVVEYHLR
jgi:ribosome-interacting GTPase 1